jgi:hypothetical protein
MRWKQKMAYQQSAAYASTESAQDVMVSAKRRQLSYNIQYDLVPSFGSPAISRGAGSWGKSVPPAVEETVQIKTGR